MHRLAISCYTFDMSLSTIADFDPWLEPQREALERQQAYFRQAERRFLDGKDIDRATLGHLFFGLHRSGRGWIFREWAPQATAMFFHCQSSDWQDQSEFALERGENGVWEIEIPKSRLSHGDHYKLHVHWSGGSGERLPSYANYTVQDERSKAFSASVWSPGEPFLWQNDAPAKPKTPLVYEAHIGMSSETGSVASYDHFRKNILPRIKQLGYNTVQLMAIQEHPYYGSFGYQVSNFFAASSRFGTPRNLKQLIDDAHGLGLYVIMDVVHSHAVKNETEGLSRFDGTLSQYFHDGARGDHLAWDSRVFDYGKPEVVHFLLSNLHFWLDEYHFDGFRFDGVTSMVYFDHGLERSFGDYQDYVSGNVDLDALSYLRMANKLVHVVKPEAMTIAEDMSGFPGLAAPISDGGIGFDYRLSMGTPDLWIKFLKEKHDEDWPLGHLLHELTSHRVEERTISYAESHDQALVGDKTIISRLLDKEIYDHMQKDDPDLVVERGITLHKMIRLITAATNAGGYLNFMGNEFGHPEWIDFPREGNDWSYHYARRQWSLADDPKLKFEWLQAFDKAVMPLLPELDGTEVERVSVDESKHVVAFQRGNLLFAFNFSPTESHVDYALDARNGSYQIILSSDDTEFGGQARIDTSLIYPSANDRIKLYLPNRCCLVLRLV